MGNWIFFINCDQNAVFIENLYKEIENHAYDPNNNFKMAFIFNE